MENFGSKQTYEAYYVTFDFVNVMAREDTIASATVTATGPNPATTDVTSTVTTAGLQNINGSRVNVWVKAGTSASTYTITCKIVTGAGEKFEFEAGLPVLDT